MKFRLSLLNFIEFAVWGAYLTCMGNYLGIAGLGDKISWFYAIQGIVSIFMPTLMGIIADKYIQPQRLLGLCHLVAGGFMLGCWWLGMQAGFGQEISDKSLFIALYTLSVAFFMPTIALSNTVAFTILKNHGLDTVKDFPPIRVFGTIGFICTMLLVNFMQHNGVSVQLTPMQFVISGIISLVLAFYAPTLPACPVKPKGDTKSFAEAFGLDAFSLFKNKRMAIFFVFSFLLGLQLQVSNGFGNGYISSFARLDGFTDVYFAKNANLLISLSQLSETCCILLIPFFMKRFGIKRVMLIAMGAWVFRFGLFGLGTPAFPSVLLFVLSCIVYGVAFDFFNISGALFVNQNVDESMRSSAQGLFMLMTNGLGAFLGSLGAQAIVTHFVPRLPFPSEVPVVSGELATQFVDGWHTTWLIFAAYGLAVFILFWLIFREKKAEKKL